LRAEERTLVLRVREGALISEQADISVDFGVSFVIVDGVDEVVLDVPLAIPLIVDGGVLLLGRMT
jgi:hypothetical protein